MVIDENIVRHEIEGARLDLAIKRREEIYEQLRPETVEGVAQPLGKAAIL